MKTLDEVAYIKEEVQTFEQEALADVPDKMSKEEFEQTLVEKRQQVQHQFNQYIASQRRLLKGWSKNDLIRKVLDLSVQNSQLTYELQQLKEVNDDTPASTPPSGGC